MKDETLCEAEQLKLEAALDERRQKIIEGFTEKKLPVITLDGVLRYVLHGVSTGSFLTAVFENDFMIAAVRADPTNKHMLDDWARLLYNQCPSACYGSKTNVKNWKKIGGLEGRVREMIIAARENQT